MFTIRKIKRIQVLYTIQVCTMDIDALRKDPYINEMRTIVWSKVVNIIEQSPTEERRKQINDFFSNTGKTKKINEFFNNHPQVFTDLIRIIHTHRLNNKQYGGWHIPIEKIPEIQQAFIFRWRTADLGKTIPDFIDLVVNNPKFISFCSEQNSLLDIWSYDFSLIPEKYRKDLIKKLIISWLTTNIPWCDETNIEEIFPRTKERIFYFLENIYGTYVGDIAWTQTLDQLINGLDKLFKTNKGSNRKRAWKVIQAFHAWGDIINIEKRYAKTIEILPQIPKKLKSIWMEIDLTNIKEEENHQWVKIYKAHFMHNGHKIEVSWRAKTPKSMLKKSWEKEEYVNKDNIRDSIWIAFVYPDEMSMSDIEELMRKWSNMYANYWYILEDKWELDIDTFERVAKESRKKPLFKSSKLWKNTNLRNANQSWFTSFRYNEWYEAIWIELQYSKKTSMEWKKKEDSIYKIKGAIDATMRWAQQASPQEIFDALTREMPEESLKDICDPDNSDNLNIKTYNDLILYLIYKKIIHPYFWWKWDKTILLFTTETHRVIFEKKWNMRPLIASINKTEYNKMLDVINWLRQTH